MKYFYFHISAVFSETGADKLNAFISNHAVTSVKEYFVEDGQNSAVGWGEERTPTPF